MERLKTIVNFKKSAPHEKFEGVSDLPQRLEVFPDDSLLWSFAFPCTMLVLDSKLFAIALKDFVENFVTLCRATVDERVAVLAECASSNDDLDFLGICMVPKGAEIRDNCLALSGPSLAMEG